MEACISHIKSTFSLFVNGIFRHSVCFSISEELPVGLFVNFCLSHHSAKDHANRGHNPKNCPGFVSWWIL